MLLILVSYVLVLCLLRTFASRLIYFPDLGGRLAGDWTPAGLPVQDVWLASSDGNRLHSWWIPNEGAKFTFIAFHGNAGNITARAPIYDFLRGTPANVLALEYRGYGRSEGSPAEQGLYLDSEAAYDYLVHEKGLDPKSILSYGQSLGTAVAVHLAAQREVAGVILEAPFPSAATVARRLFWFLPGLHLITKSQFDTTGKLRQVQAPVLIVHCAQDPVLPLDLGQEVYTAVRSPKSFVKIDSYCHEEASLIDPLRYRTSLKRFLDTLTARQ